MWLSWNADVSHSCCLFSLNGIARLVCVDKTFFRLPGLLTSWLCNQLSVHSRGFILLLKCTSYCLVQTTSAALPPPTGLNWCRPSPRLACSLIKAWCWNQIWDLAKAAGTSTGGLPRCTLLKWEQKSKIKRKWQQQQCVRCAEKATGWASLAEKQKPVTVPQTLVTFSHYWVITIIIGRSHHVLILKETRQTSERRCSLLSHTCCIKVTCYHITNDITQEIDRRRSGEGRKGARGWQMNG